MSTSVVTWPDVALAALIVFAVVAVIYLLVKYL